MMMMIAINELMRKLQGIHIGLNSRVDFDCVVGISHNYTFDDSHRFLPSLSRANVLVLWSTKA